MLPWTHETLLRAAIARMAGVEIPDEMNETDDMGEMDEMNDEAENAEGVSE